MQRNSENPHAWTMIEVDVSNLVALRQQLKNDFMRREDVPLSLSPFVLKPIVNALKEFPILNSIWHSGQHSCRKGHQPVDSCFYFRRCRRNPCDLSCGS